MKTITKTFNLNDIHNNDSNTNNTADNFINNSLCSEHTIFFDIETTGFSHKTSFCYLIGTAYIKNSILTIIQWLAQSKADEVQVIASFLNAAASFDTLVHFNGDNFDIPFIKDKAAHLNIPYTLDKLLSYDLYKCVRPLKALLKLESCNQKSVEQFLNISRDDEFSGGELIKVYNDYVKTGEASYEELLLLHNYDDVYGLIQLSSITAYNAVLEENVTYTGYSVEYSDDTNKNGDLIINYTLPCAVPIPVIHLDNNGYAIRINGNTMKIKLPLITDNLRLYYSDYKNYYYLPYEDTAIHKSVAAYVDAECKVKATRETAYTKKFASFIKLPCYNTDSLQTSEYIFRYEYNDANIYLLYDKKELPEDIILQAVHILITFFCRKTTH